MDLHDNFELNFWSQLRKLKCKQNSCFIVLEVEQPQGEVVQLEPEPPEVDTVQGQVAIQLPLAAELGLQVEAALLNQHLSVIPPPLPQF